MTLEEIQDDEKLNGNHIAILSNGSRSPNSAQPYSVKTAAEMVNKEYSSKSHANDPKTDEVKAKREESLVDDRSKTSCNTDDEAGTTTIGNRNSLSAAVNTDTSKAAGPKLTNLMDGSGNEQEMVNLEALGDRCTIM